MLILPDPDFLWSAAAVAVMVTAAGLGTVAGAEYIPVGSTEPLALPPTTAHVTVWSVAPITVAENF
jgi:hypothetical protein